MEYCEELNNNHKKNLEFSISKPLRPTIVFWMSGTTIQPLMW